MGLPFLRVPPFPGGRPRGGTSSASAVAPDDRAALADAIVRRRVGGAFWAQPHTLPPGRDVLLVPSSRAMAAEMSAEVGRAGLRSRAVAIAPPGWFAGAALPCLDPDADPWRLAEQAEAVWAGADEDIALVAALRGDALRVFGPGRAERLATHDGALLACLADLPADPFGGAPWDPAAAIAQLGDWRALIEANRDARAIYGVARWKRVTMDALLWDGRGPVRHAAPSRRTPALGAGDTVLAWTSRVAAPVIAGLAARGVRIGEIEDGMIRSQGLGANCVPPLSVIVDRAGVHFDPSRPSDLERLLSDATFEPPLLDRAAALRTRLVAGGLSKYGAAPAAPEARPPSATRRVLVPGDRKSVV